MDLEDNDKIRIYSDEDGLVKLTIRDLTPNDSGLYSCLAKNKNGSAKSVANLRVKGEYGGKDRSNIPFYTVS